MNLPAAIDAPSAAAARRAPGALADRVRALFSYAGTTLVGNLLGALVLLALFSGSAPTATLWGWTVAFALLWIGRALLARAYARAAPADDAASRRWIKPWNAGTLASGCLWGAAAWLFYGHGQVLHQLALVLVVYSFCVGSIPLLASQQRVFIAFIALAFVPTIVRIATFGGPGSLALAGVMLLIFAMTARLGRNYRSSFDDLVVLKARTQALLEQLRLEKAAADAARREAELASRAKTQFFAAASHDLRQPLHALGLFAEALRGKSQDVEVTQLVHSINASVDALEGLFSELLDITRIDSGGVDVRPVDFKLDDVLRRIRLHFEPVAFEKGLALRLRGGAHSAFADPLLVERILRNLTSNALRYTEDGSVLVSARPRAGRLFLQVWDTGVGIHPRDQQRIFEEFVQLSASESLAPHQRKGLGLGLAIVRRLAGLLDAPLSMRSQPGRGTVFTLELPLGKAPREAPQVPAGRAPLTLTLQGKRIAIVEDDAAVLAGLKVLLSGWGAAVLDFDSAGAALRWLAQGDSAAQPIDLLIADLRLEGGHTGVEVIQAARASLGAKLPALVVTGSLMTGHEAEAQEYDFHLLLKPVVPNKLRSMIAFKLGLR
jgi:two-component system, sensor histidine kinase